MTSAAPEVSVIIPVYNGARYVVDAIGSVLEQTHRDLEIVVVDDGSTDDSPAILGRFAAPVRVIRQENGGTGAARNRGVSASRGELLAFLDQDDLWMPAKLTMQIAALRTHAELEAVFGMVEQFHSPELGEGFRQRIPIPRAPIPGYLPSAMLVKRTAFERIGPFGERWQLVEWTEWFVRAIELGLVLSVLPEVVARRRLHEGNKGLALRSFQTEYPRILKALLDRKRAQ